MKRLNQIILLAILSLSLFQSCKREKIEDYVPKEYVNENESNLRIINTVSIPRRIDYYINDQKMNGDSIAYPGTFPAADFLRVPSGNVNFKVKIPATASDIYSTSLNMAAGKYNTLWVIDTLPTIDSYMITDDNLVPPPDSGKVAIRFVNVTKGLPPVNFVNITTSTADTIARNIAYKSNTPWIIVNSGSSLKFQLYLSGTTTPVGATLTQSLTANRMYTFYVRGRYGVTGTYAPTLVAIVTK